MRGRANQTTGLTNGKAVNLAPEVEFSPFPSSTDVPVLLLNQPSVLLQRLGCYFSQVTVFETLPNCLRSHSDVTTSFIAKAS